MRLAHPRASVLVHPECTPEVTALADFVASTEGMCRHVGKSQAEEFIIGTETGIIHRMSKETPGKKFFPVSERAVCPNMKKTTLEKVLWALEDMATRITVPQDIAAKAKLSISRMLETIE